MFCQNCGAKNAEEANFCVSCGAKLNSTEQNKSSEIKSEVKSTTLEEQIEESNFPEPLENVSVGAVILEENSLDEDNVIRSMIGKNAEYFMDSFKRIERGERGKFNFAAFFINTFYALYRKQYKLFLVASIPYILYCLSTFMIVNSFVSLDFVNIIAGYGVGILGMVMQFIIAIVMGINFNKWYYKRIKLDIQNSDTLTDAFIKKSYGTSMKNVVIASVLISILSSLSFAPLCSSLSNIEENYEDLEEYESTESYNNTDKHFSEELELPEEKPQKPSTENDVVAEEAPYQVESIVEVYPYSQSILASLPETVMFCDVGESFNNAYFEAALNEYQICYSDNGDMYLRIVLAVFPYKDMHMSDSGISVRVMRVDENGELDTLFPSAMEVMYDNYGNYANYCSTELTYLGSGYDYGVDLVAYDFNISNIDPSSLLFPVVIDTTTNEQVIAFPEAILSRQ